MTDVISILSATQEHLATLPPRERVFALEAAIRREIAVPQDSSTKQLAEIELPLRHYIAGGVYAREMFIPAGAVLTGKIHKHEHLAMVVRGDISVYDENGLKRLRGPYTFVSRPGIKRAGYAHEDTLFITIHRMANPGETNIDELEKEFVVITYEEFDTFMEQVNRIGLPAGGGA